jgi:uncharacterized protein (DUF983 family)
MSEVIHETQQDFWRPPSPLMSQMSEPVALHEVTPEAAPVASVMAEACPRCGTEFLLGSQFCHSCGRRRPQAMSAVAHEDAAAIARMWVKTVAWVRVLPGKSASMTVRVWNRIHVPAWVRYLHFHEIQGWIGLPTASLIAFLIGLGCLAGALLVGLLTARNLVDWQAIQFYRAEWLLAATAAFVAGILLKRPSDRE